MLGDKIKSILVGVDENIEGNVALQYGARLAHLLHARLRVIHVIEEALIYPGWGAIVTKRREEIERQRERMRMETEKYTDRLAITIDITIEEGLSPASVILKELHDKDYDLLVVGSHGASAMMEFLLGGISSQIIHHTRKPVVVVKKMREISKILMCTAGSECSFKAIRYAAAIADAAGADTTVLSVSQWKSREAVSQAWEYAHRGAQVLKECGVEAKELVRVGRPAEEILAEARRQDFDLIVMGYRGKSTVADVLLGEVVSKVMHHSLRPTLVFHA